MTDEKRLLELWQLHERLHVEINRLERKLLNGPKVRRPNRQKIAACGTPAGYYRHRRQLHDEPCDDCKAAHAFDNRMRELRRREDAIREAS